MTMGCYGQISVARIFQSFPPRTALPFRRKFESALVTSCHFLNPMPHERESTPACCGDAYEHVYYHCCAPKRSGQPFHCGFRVKSPLARIPDGIGRAWVLHGFRVFLHHALGIPCLARSPHVAKCLSAASAHWPCYGADPASTHSLCMG